jgi:hypothetical protein
MSDGTESAMHKVGNFGLEYTARRSWKARLFEYYGQKFLQVVPVAWTKHMRKKKLEVWYQSEGELLLQLNDSQPFIVALARAKDDKNPRPEFDRFVAVFLVKATGKRLGPKHLEVEVLRRLDEPEIGLRKHAA